MSLKIYIQNLQNLLSSSLDLIENLLGQGRTSQENLLFRLSPAHQSFWDKNQTCAVTLANNVSLPSWRSVSTSSTLLALQWLSKSVHLYNLIAGFLLSYIVLWKFWVICLDILALSLAALKIMHWTWYWAYSAALPLKCCPRIDCLCQWLDSRKSPHREDASFFGELWAVRDSPVLMETVSWHTWRQWQFLHPSVSCWSLRCGAQQWRLRFSFLEGLQSRGGER